MREIDAPSLLNISVFPLEARPSVSFSDSNSALHRPLILFFLVYKPQIDSHMSSLQQFHPGSHPQFLHDVAADRFKDGLSNRREDLDESIELLMDDTSPDPQTLLELTLALLHRVKKFGFEEIEDVNSTITHLRKINNFPPEAFNLPHHAIKTSFIEMLATRVEEQSGDALKDINEILLLCGQFTPATSPRYLTSASQALNRAVLDSYSRGKKIESLDQAIRCAEALKTYSPSLHQVSLDLAELLAARFLVRHTDNDYKEAKELLDCITVSRRGRDQCECRYRATALATALGHAHSLNLEDSERTSHCQSARSFLDNSRSYGNPLHPVVIELLGSCVERPQVSYPGVRTNLALSTGMQLALPTDMQLTPSTGMQLTPSTGTQLFLFTGTQSSSSTGTQSDRFVAAGSDIVSASLALENKIAHLRDLSSKSGLGTELQRNNFKELVRCYNTKILLTHDTTFIGEAIMYHRMLIATIHPTDKLKFFYLSTFGDFLHVSFDRTERVEYLNESIDLHREALRDDSSRPTYFDIIRRLIKLLWIRWERFHSGEDLDDTMVQFELAVKDTYTMVPPRFDLACEWASSARISGHNSLSTAYENAMLLMQVSLVFAPTLPTQHNRLVEKRDLYEKTPLSFASHHISTGQLDRAIEGIEHGRALLWSEMRGLRISTDQLRSVNPDLADRFTAISRELELLTTSVSPDGSVGMGHGDLKRGVDSATQFSRLQKRQYELLKERDALILEIRGLKGLEKFLLPLPFDTLRSAALHGPVIIINHCELGSDIIIVLHNSRPSHIPTPPDFFNRANQLKVRLLKTRKDYGLDSNEHEDMLFAVLAELYELVGRLVIERLKELGIDEQSRVWWCPTSVFLDLPLHAMGPIPSSDGVTRYFSDLYISSYTPTLSALIASRRPGTQRSTQNSSQSPQGARPNTLLIRSLNLQVRILPRANTTVLGSLQSQQFAHIPYHVALKRGNPFDAVMLCHNEERFTLLDVMRSQLPAGELAFLPGSHTAEITEGCIPDEVLHFSTAVQYSGFRSVIGTMWKMDVEDGRNLAKNVYESMFSKNESVEPYYKRSAKALQYAVQQIRPGLRLVRWVNYVHYGA